MSKSLADVSPLQVAGASATGAVVSVASTGERGIGTRVGRYRWLICALLFFATTINYIDRQVFGLLKTTLQGELGWNEIDYSNVAFAFTTAYAIGLVLVGRLMDWLGTRKGFFVRDNLLEPRGNGTCFSHDPSWASASRASPWVWARPGISRPR